MKKILGGTLSNGETILKIVVNEEMNDEWDIRKNEYGIVVSKGTSSVVSVLVKDKDGWCWYLEDVYFKCEWSGSSWESPQPYSGWHWVKCKCE